MTAPNSSAACKRHRLINHSLAKVEAPLANGTDKSSVGKADDSATSAASAKVAVEGGMQTGGAKDKGL